MWASKIRTQATVKGKINTIDWLEGSHASSDHCNGAGWIASGGTRSELCVSWFKNEDRVCYGEESTYATESGLPLYRTQFNLRGHSVGVKFVRWKPQGDKLLSFDSWGNLIVWKNRANIFAVDFSFTIVTPITDIQWSPCGMYIALCGDEGQLQVMSGHNGTSIFAIHAVSTTLHGSYAEFTCLSWSADSGRLVLGTNRGEVTEMDPNNNGQFLSLMTMHESIAVSKVDYFGSVEYIKLPHHQQDSRRRNSMAAANAAAVPAGGVGGGGGDDNWIASQGLSVYMENGEVAIFPTFTETRCSYVQTRIFGGIASWNHSQTLLAVVGHRATQEPSSLMLRLVNPDAYIVMTIEPLVSLPHSDPTSISQFRLSSICWGLKDSMIFLACGPKLLSVDVVTSEVPSLRLLCRELLAGDKHMSRSVHKLPLPFKEISILKTMKSSLIPLPYKLPSSHPGTQPSLSRTNISFNDQLLFPLLNNRRLHCIIIAEHRSTGRLHTSQDISYSLQYEHFGSYIPLLKATKKLKTFHHIEFDIRPELKGAHRSGSLHRDTFRQGDNTAHWGATPTARPESEDGNGTSRPILNRGLMVGALIRRAVTHIRRHRNDVVEDGTTVGDNGNNNHSDSDIGHHGNDSHHHDNNSSGEGVTTPPCLPPVAELVGNKLLNKFKVLKTAATEKDMGEGVSPSVLGTVNVNSHHITCEPRGMGITVLQSKSHSATGDSASNNGIEEDEGGEREGQPSGTATMIALSSKKPVWNPRYRMYELDFGGRISRNSVKNFQIEKDGEIVLQFGRSNFADYCLDFQDPFSPVVALGIAIAAIHSM